jgi:hypothetical protein
MFEDLSDIYDWLYEESGEKRIMVYLCLLKLNWSDNEEHTAYIKGRLRVYAKLAQILSSSPETVRRFILAPDWRYQLIGNAVAILQQEPAFADDILTHLLEYSWIAPQLAAGFALLNSDGKNILRLEKAFSQPAERVPDRTKMAASIYAALKLTGSETASAFEQSPLFQALHPDDGDSWIELVNRHYQFWKAYPLRCADELNA